jgi:hypothetical protein
MIVYKVRELHSLCQVLRFTSLCLAQFWSYLVKLTQEKICLVNVKGMHKIGLTHFMERRPFSEKLIIPSPPQDNLCHLWSP